MGHRQKSNANTDEHQLLDMRSLHSQLYLFNDNFENEDVTAANGQVSGRNITKAARNHTGSFHNSSLETSICATQRQLMDHQQSFGPASSAQEGNLLAAERRQAQDPKQANAQSHVISVVSCNSGVPAPYLATGNQSVASVQNTEAEVRKDPPGAAHRQIGQHLAHGALDHLSIAESREPRRHEEDKLQSRSGSVDRASSSKHN